MTRAPAPQDALAEVVAALAAARKYRDVAPGVLRRVAVAALAIERRSAAALKRAKAKLHQIHAAFLPEASLARATESLARLPDDPTPTAIESCSAEVLACHASTRERRPPRAALYRDLFARTGPPRSIVDLGCGLHPFALPSMGLPRAMAYEAVDLDVRMVGLVAAFFKKVGQRGHARAHDLLGDEPLPAGDVAFLLKLLPTLERQSRGAAARLLDRVDARALVLSFPTRALGGRGERGRAAHYEAFAHELLASRGGPGRTLATRDELFVIVAPPRRAPAA
jgi:16S rRNA (guanine(1405)-N(7))-methyltransferase